MQKSHIATNRKQKASSAATLKASHLTVISNTGNRPMNNSTAENLKNQVEEACAVIGEALDAVTQAVEHMQGFEALFKSIRHQINNSQTSSILGAAKLGEYVSYDFHYILGNHKSSLENHLKMLGGDNNE